MSTRKPKALAKAYAERKVVIELGTVTWGGGPSARCWSCRPRAGPCPDQFPASERRKHRLLQHTKAVDNLVSGGGSIPS